MENHPLIASGVGYGTVAGCVDYVRFREYRSCSTETPESVVDRFIRDGFDGELRLTATESPMGVRHLTVFRRDEYGSATYWDGRVGGARHWVTLAERPPREWAATSMHTFFAAQSVVVPFTILSRALLEFLGTRRRPLGVSWQAVRSP
jgi:hypothetical protein